MGPVVRSSDATARSRIMQKSQSEMIAAAASKQYSPSSELPQTPAERERARSREVGKVGGISALLWIIMLSGQAQPGVADQRLVSRMTRHWVRHSTSYSDQNVQRPYLCVEIAWPEMVAITDSIPPPQAALCAHISEGVPGRREARVDARTQR